MTGGFSQKGTYNYMAPEVEKATNYNEAVDIYSLGIVLYWLTNKRHLPFLSVKQQLISPNDLKTANRRRLDGEPLPAPCDASAPMAEVILCASNPDPSKRFASATAMKNALLSVANGTYASTGDVLNRTITDRRADHSQDLNPTTIVRHADRDPKSAQRAVSTFGKKKKSKTPAITAAILTVALLRGGGVFTTSRLLRDNDGKENASVSSSEKAVVEETESTEVTVDTKNGVYSDFDEEQISAAIKEAEALVADKNYEGALTTIKTALSTYPKSEELQSKENEYTDALAAQEKANTLKEAANLAESGDYVSAIALIKNAQDVSGQDADYTNAYNSYSAAYKAVVISTADDLANGGDYVGAIQTVNDAFTVVGDDTDLSAKSASYEDSYVTGIIAQADELLAVEDFDGADELVNTARSQFHSNTALSTESDKIASLRPVGSKDIMQILSESVLSQSGTYKAYLGSDSINAFAEDQYNAFSINTAVSYNMWGGGVQNVSFKISKFTFDTLNFTICGETGTSGSVTIDVFLDHSVDDGSPDYSFTLDDAAYPINAVIDVSGKTTMAFKVTNHAGRENRIVFYDFEGT
jgi:tetratricopeptide (TPR) repeat protein